MRIVKVTTGFVIQTFDTDTREFTSQRFTASDDTTWEDDRGEVLGLGDEQHLEMIYGKGGVDEPYLDFEMVQPNETVQPKN